MIVHVVLSWSMAAREEHVEYNSLYFISLYKLQIITYSSRINIEEAKHIHLRISPEQEQTLADKASDNSAKYDQILTYCLSLLELVLTFQNALF